LRLGPGDKGVVDLACSPSGRRVAVKVVHRQYADDVEFRTRFGYEVASARRLGGASPHAPSTPKRTPRAPEWPPLSVSRRATQ
jgi:hypothetical protein